MEAWGLGVFDNAVAVAWADRFDRSVPMARPIVLRATLQAVTGTGGAGSDGAGSAALAAAAVVASGLPGGRLLPSGYGPKTLAGNPFQVTPDLSGLALQALAQVRSPDSSWSRDWRAAGMLEDAVAVVDAVVDEIEDRCALRLDHAS